MEEGAAAAGAPGAAAAGARAGGGGGGMPQQRVAPAVLRALRVFLRQCCEVMLLPTLRMKTLPAERAGAEGQEEKGEDADADAADAADEAEEGDAEEEDHADMEVLRALDATLMGSDDVRAVLERFAGDSALHGIFVEMVKAEELQDGQAEPAVGGIGIAFRVEADMTLSKESLGAISVTKVRPASRLQRRRAMAAQLQVSSLAREVLSNARPLARVAAVGTSGSSEAMETRVLEDDELEDHDGEAGVVDVEDDPDSEAGAASLTAGDETHVGMGPRGSSGGPSRSTSLLAVLQQYSNTSLTLLRKYVREQQEMLRQSTRVGALADGSTGAAATNADGASAEASGDAGVDAGGESATDGSAAGSNEGGAVSEDMQRLVKRLRELDLAIAQCQQGQKIALVTFSTAPQIMDALARAGQNGELFRRIQDMVATGLEKVSSAQAQAVLESVGLASQSESEAEARILLTEVSRFVKHWPAEIQRVNGLVSTEFPETALEEVNFWTMLQGVLTHARRELECPHVVLTLLVLKRGNRVSDKVIRDQASQLVSTSEQVARYVAFLKDYPVHSLMSASDLDQLRSAAVAALKHFAKLRPQNYEVDRATMLVKATSKLVYDQLLAILRDLSPLQIRYSTFAATMAQTHELMRQWDREFTIVRHALLKKIRGGVPDILKHPDNLPHIPLKKRCEELTAFREKHERLRQVMQDVFRDDVAGVSTDDGVVSEEDEALENKKGENEETAAAAEGAVESKAEAGKGQGRTTTAAAAAAAAAAAESRGRVAHDVFQKLDNAYNAVFANADPLTLTDSGLENWSKAMAQYGKSVSDLEERIAKLLEGRLRRAGSSEEMFRAFAQFNPLLDRPAVHEAVLHVQLRLIGHVKQDVHKLRDKLALRYDRSAGRVTAALRDIPPLSGRILWARQVEHQLDMLMNQMGAVLGPSWRTHPDGKSLIELCEDLRQALDTQKMYRDWLRDWEAYNLEYRSHHSAGMQTLILLAEVDPVAGRRRLRVNFDQKTVMLFKEVRNLEWLGHRLEWLGKKVDAWDSIRALAKQSADRYPVAMTLQAAVRGYEHSMGLIRAADPDENAAGHDHAQPHHHHLHHHHRHHHYRHHHHRHHALHDQKGADAEQQVDTTFAINPLRILLTNRITAVRDKVRDAFGASRGRRWVKWDDDATQIWVAELYDTVMTLQGKTEEAVRLMDIVNERIDALYKCKFTFADIARAIAGVQQTVDDIQGFANKQVWVQFLDERIESILCLRLESGIKAWLEAFEEQFDAHQDDAVNSGRRGSSSHSSRTRALSHADVDNAVATAGGMSLATPAALPAGPMSGVVGAGNANEDEDAAQHVVELDDVTHRVTLSNQTLHLTPPLEDSRTLCIGLFHEHVGIICQQKRLVAQELQAFGTDKTEDAGGAATYESVLRLIDPQLVMQPYAAIEQQLENVRAYTQQWLQYQALWDASVSMVQDRLGDRIGDWVTLLQEVRDARAMIEDAHNERRFGPVVVNFMDVRLVVNHKYDAWQTELLATFKERLASGIVSLLEEVTERQKALGCVAFENASSTAEVVTGVHLVQELKRDFRKYQIAVEQMDIGERLLKRQSKKPLADDWPGVDNLGRVFSQLSTSLDQSNKIMREKLPQLQEQVRAESARTSADTEDLLTRWTDKKPLGGDISASEALDTLAAFESQLRQAEEANERVLAAKRALGLNALPEDRLGYVQQEIEDLRDVWGCVVPVSDALSSIRATLWRDVDALKVRKSLDEVRRTLRELPSKVTTYEAFTTLQGRISRYHSTYATVRDLKSNAVRDRHWKTLLQGLGLAGELGTLTLSTTAIRLEEMTLGELWDADVQKVSNRKIIEEVLSMAQGEMALEVFLQEVKEYWQARELTMVAKHDSSSGSNQANRAGGSSTAGAAVAGAGGDSGGSAVRLVTNWGELFDQSEEHLNMLQGMRQSPYFRNVREFEEDTTAWEDRLTRLRLLLEVWMDVQRKWVYLRGIFANSDIRTQLVTQYNKYRSVDMEFLSFMRKVAMKPMIMEVLALDGVQRALERQENSMTLIQKALGDYLERQRALFSRFYFVNNEDLVEIIGNANEPSKVVAHLPKMFAALASLQTDMETHNTATAIVSRDGERVPLQDPVTLLAPKLAVREWLGSLEAQMRQTIAALLDSAMRELEVANGAAGKASAEQTEAGNARLLDWIGRFPAQVIILATQIDWCMRMEKDLRDSSATADNGVSGSGERVRLADVSSRLDALLMLLSRSVLRRDTVQQLRSKFEQLITEVVHQRDVTRELQARFLQGDGADGAAKAGAMQGAGEFAWLYHLRFYWTPDAPEVFDRLSIRMSNAEFNYGYEYLGIGERLVHTPLTDRCYLTLTQALHFRMGGNPFGPAGTGKTESVKMLGGQLGRFVLVFNCDEHFDYSAMGRLFAGLCQVGAWGCFDEFNRLEERILSAVSQQILAIQRGLAARAAEIDLALARPVRLSPDVGIFVTMNLGYAGRSNLPDNLKALFRAVAMVEPDRKMIAQVMLFAQGITTAEELAGKIVLLFELCEEQLSTQPHYDFGLRALKTVLAGAGSLKRQQLAQGDATETAEAGGVGDAASADQSSADAQELAAVERDVLIRSTCNTVVAKLVADDIPLFVSLLRAIFPNCSLPDLGEARLVQEIERACRKNRILAKHSWLEKVLQLKHVLELRHGVMLVGPAGSGKTMAWRCLLTALEAVEGVKAEYHVIDPKAMSKEQLFGELDHTTLEWTDGVFTSVLRKVSDQYAQQEQAAQAENGAAVDVTKNGAARPLTAVDNDGEGVVESKSAEGAAGTTTTANANAQHIHRRHWIVFDGDVDPEWAENLNSVLDDNRILTLPSGDRLKLPPNVRILVEVDSLRYATLATVSRCGMVWFSEHVVSPSMAVWNLLQRLAVDPVASVDGSALSSPETSALARSQFVDALSPLFLSWWPSVQSLVPDDGTRGGVAKGSAGSNKRGRRTARRPRSAGSDSGDAAGAAVDVDAALDREALRAYSNGQVHVRGSTAVLKAEYDMAMRSVPEVTPGSGGAAGDGGDGSQSASAVSSSSLALSAFLTAFQYMQEHASDDVMEVPSCRFLSTLVALLQRGLVKVVEHNDANPDFPMSQEHMHRFATRWGLYSMLWAFSASLSWKFRIELAELLVSYDAQAELPEGTSLVDVYPDVASGEWLNWSASVPRTEIESHRVVEHDVVVPTDDTVRHDELLRAWLGSHKPLIMCGPPGSGKTMTLTNTLQAMPELVFVGLNFSSATTPDLILKTFAQYCEEVHTKEGLVLQPNRQSFSETNWLVVFCDEINLPENDTYGTQRVIMFLRQLVEHGGYWSPENRWIRTRRIQFVGACNPPTDAGRVEMSSRFLRHVPLLFVDCPAEQSLRQIFSTFNSALLKIQPTLRSHVDSLTEAMIDFYVANQRRFTRDMAPQYIYSPRELTRWVRAMHEAMTEGEGDMSAEEMVRLWAHEGLRLFQDRLIAESDRQWCDSMVDEVAMKNFPGVDMAALERPLLFSKWIRKVYESVERGALKDHVAQRLKAFYEEELDVPLVVFDDVLEHVLRIDNVLRHPMGHVLLVGESGVGKTVLSKFVAWMNNLHVFQIKANSRYTLAQFDEDLRELMRRVGVNGEQVCFIFDESNALSSSFLERMNALLASGEVPGLFEGEELRALLASCREAAHREEGGAVNESEDDLYRRFTKNVQRNLHVVFTINPASAEFADRCLTSPALFNRCVVDWFGTWSGDALTQVAYEFTAQLDVGQTEYTMPTTVDDRFVAQAFSAVTQLIARLHGDDTPAPEPTLRDAVVAAIVEMHQCMRRLAGHVEQESSSSSSSLSSSAGASSNADDSLTSSAQRLFVSPRDFLDFIRKFVELEREKRGQLEERKAHISAGLRKLEDTQTDVGRLQAELGTTEQVLKEKETAANEKLQLMVGKQQEAQQHKGESEQLSKQLEERNSEIAQRREGVERELSEAEPALNSARESVQSIKKTQLDEVRSMPQPPNPVRLTMEAVVALLGNGTKEWTEIRRIIRKDDFISTIVNFDATSLSPRQIKQVEDEYVNRTDLEPRLVSRASKACGPLYVWVVSQVRYSTILRKVQPLRDEMEGLQKESDELQERMSHVEAEIAELEQNIATYKAEYAEAIRDIEAVKNEKDVVASKVERAKALLSSLESEMHRWSASSADFDKQMSTLIADCLLSAAFLTYAGALDHKRRRLVMLDWSDTLQSLGIPFQEELSVVDYLSRPAQRFQWRSLGLPADNLCVENAILLERFNRFPLVIDPSGQATQYILNKYADRKITRSSFLDRSFYKTLASCIRFGTPLLVQDVETVDPILNPVLNREVFKAGGRTLIRLGSEDIDYSPRFLLVLTTRDSSAQFSPDLCSRVTMVNFTVTPASLESQALACILRAERPEVEEQRENVLHMQEEQAVRLRELEEKLLDEISTVQGNILDDDRVVHVMEQLKSDASALAADAAKTQELLEEVQRSAHAYEHLAAAMSRTYFALERLASVHDLYQLSLRWFLSVVDGVLESEKRAGASGGAGALEHKEQEGTAPVPPATATPQAAEQRVRELSTVFFREVARRVMRGLLITDRVMLGTVLAAICMNGREAEQLSAAEWDAFQPQGDGGAAAAPATAIVGPGTGGVHVELAQKAMDTFGKLDEWSAATNSAVQQVLRLPFGEDFVTHMVENQQPWMHVLVCADPENQIPEDWMPEQTHETRRSLLRALITRVLRPDRLLAALERHVYHVFGDDFPLHNKLDLQEIAMRDGEATSPILLCTEVGQDLSPRVDALAASSGVQLFSVSMGSAEGYNDAERMIANAAKSGSWVMLRNVHLCPEWLTALEKKLHALQPRPTYRLFLTSEISSALPTSLVRLADVVLVESAAGIKFSVQRFLSSVDPARLQRAPAERGRLHVLLAWLNAVVRERLRYVPLGWSKRYEFRDVDAHCAMDVIDYWIDRAAGPRSHISPDDIPWSALRTMLSQSLYGGRIDNAFDQRVLDSFISELFGPHTFNPEFVLVKAEDVAGGKTNDATSFFAEGEASGGTDADAYASGEAGNDEAEEEDQATEHDPICLPIDFSASGIAEWAASVPSHSAPTWLGLPATAEAALQTQLGREAMQSLVSVADAAGLDSVGGGGGAGGVAGSATPGARKRLQSAGPQSRASLVARADDAHSPLAVLGIKVTAWLSGLPPVAKLQDAAAVGLSVAAAAAAADSGPEPSAEEGKTTDTAAESATQSGGDGRWANHGWSLQRCVRRETARARDIVALVRADLEQVAQLCEGRIRPTMTLRSLVSCLLQNTTPSTWVATYRTQKGVSLAEWLADLIKRCNLLLHDYAPILRGERSELRTCSFWLGGLFHAEAFFTATRQHVAEATGLSLEDLHVELHVGDDDAGKQQQEEEDKDGGDSSVPLAVNVDGLVVAGAVWDASTKALRPSTDLQATLPNASIRWVPTPSATDAAAASVADEPKDDSAKPATRFLTLPLYLNETRSTVVSEVRVRVPENVADEVWYERGVALMSWVR